MPITQQRLHNILLAAENILGHYRMNARQCLSTARELESLGVPQDKLLALYRMGQNPDIPIGPELATLAEERTRWHYTHKKNEYEARSRARRRIREGKDPFPQSKFDQTRQFGSLAQEALKSREQINLEAQDLPMSPYPPSTAPVPEPYQNFLVGPGGVQAPNDGPWLPEGTLVVILPSGLWYWETPQEGGTDEDDLDAALTEGHDDLGMNRDC